MSEYINAYDIHQPYQVIPMERDDFYNEQIEVYKKTWKPSKSIDIINVILFNESGEIILQKRASHKRHNANLLDKTIGGHITNGDEPNYTMMVEAVQELGVPSLVTKDYAEFIKTYGLLSAYLKSIALIEYIDTQTFEFKKNFDDEMVVISNRVHFYIWVYWGAVKNLDKEVAGVLFYWLDELEKQIVSAPDLFTDDLSILLNAYKKEIKEFVNTLHKKD